MAAALAVATTASAQTFDQPLILARRGDSVALLHVWADAVRNHQPNRFDASAQRASALEPQQLAELWVEVRSVLGLMDSPRQRVFTIEDERFRRRDVLYTTGELDDLRRLARSLGGRDPLEADSGAEADRAVAARTQFIKRAAILHSDIARLAAGSPGAVRPPPGAAPVRGVIDFSDGKVLGIDRSGDHWAFARNLLERVPAAPRDPDVRLWYRASLAWLLGVMQLQWPQFDQAQRLYPGDPELLYLRGCLHETLASPRLHAIARSGILAPSQTGSLREARAELQDAESFLQRALRADPALVEARLHLGRVQELLGRHGAAVATLRTVIGSAADPLVVYYANLFLGSALESAGDRNGARVAYERAAAQSPASQAARLAISALATAAGERAAALDAVEAGFQRRSGNDEDPWWRYYVSAGRTGQAQIEAAYAAFAHQGPR